MPDKGWKAWERRVANVLGVTRIGPTGDDGPDILAKNWSVQCKLRKSIPQWLTDALENAVEGAKGSRRIGWAIMKRSGRGYPDRDAIVMIRWEDFQRMIAVYDAFTAEESEIVER